MSTFLDTVVESNLFMKKYSSAYNNVAGYPMKEQLQDEKEARMEEEIDFSAIMPAENEECEFS